jgi:hypothetical protein
MYFYDEYLQISMYSFCVSIYFKFLHIKIAIMKPYVHISKSKKQLLFVCMK